LLQRSGVKIAVSDAWKAGSGWRFAKEVVCKEIGINLYRKWVDFGAFFIYFWFFLLNCSRWFLYALIIEIRRDLGRICSLKQSFPLFYPCIKIRRKVQNYIFTGLG
jgi:hypothetical protein